MMVRWMAKLPTSSGVRWVYLRRGIEVREGDTVTENMIERRWYVLAWFRVRDALGSAWFRARMWVSVKRQSAA
jgi:hypothetical protein